MLRTLFEKMNKRIVILGGGESGVGAALLAKQQGYDVFVSDASSLKENYRNELRNTEINFEEEPLRRDDRCR